MRKSILVLLIILFSLPLYATTNVKPVFEDEIDMKKMNPSQSIIFDNYEEVFIKNFEDQGVTEIHFLGNVKIRFQGNVLKARKVVVTAKAKQVLEISAYENVEFKYGSDIYLCKNLVFEPEQQRGVLKNVRSYMGGGANIGPMSSSSGWYYTAQKVTILDKSRVVLEKVVFTTSDELVPHYSFYAGKLWFFKHKVVYALNLSYTVGQSDFIYFPFFLKWEKGTGIKTAFAQEKRIGWYMMNSYTFHAPYGKYDVGLDLYERLGEYAFVKFNTTRAISNITRINAELEVADDVRLFADSTSDRYTQLQDVYGDGNFTSIRQFSWRYKFDIDFKTSDMGVKINWENMNDPVFSSKYNQSRQNNFDVKKLLQPDDNYFFTRSDSSLTSTGQTLNRGFSLSAGKFSLNGNWTYTSYVANDTNQYLNSRYDYYVSRRSLPNLSFAPKDIQLIKKLESKTPLSFSVAVSNTNLIFNTGKELQQFMALWYSNNTVDQTNTISKLSNKNEASLKVKGETNTSSTNQTSLTNQASITQAPALRVITNYFVFYDASSSLNTRLSFTASESLETNGDVKSDTFNHTETGGLTFNGNYLNRLLIWNNSFSFRNTKSWTSLGTNYNDTFNSGSDLSLNSSLSMNKELVAFKDKKNELKVPLKVSHSLSHQLYKTISASKPRETLHTTSLNSGLNMYKNQLSWNLALRHTLRYRITNDVEDIYLNNKLEQRLTASTGLKVWWLSAGTSMSLDLLETKSNALEMDYADFTNRLSGNPRLSVSLTVPNSYFKASYLYDLIDATNVNMSLDSKWSFKNLKVPLFYELTSLNFDATFYYDFLQKTSSIFTLSFSLNLSISKYWKLNFNTSVRNNQIYRYFVSDASTLPSGVTPLNFWEDLGDSLKIWDYDALKRGNFKIQGLHFNLEHDLDEWLLTIQFNVNRRIDTVRMFAYWEPAIRVEFSLAGSGDQFPPYNQKFVPPEYQ